MKQNTRAHSPLSSFRPVADALLEKMPGWETSRLLGMRLKFEFQPKHEDGRIF